MRCKHCSNHQMRCMPSEPSANDPPPLPLQGARELHKGGGCVPRAGRCPPWGGNRGVTSQPRAGQSTSYGDVKSIWGGGRVGQEWVRKRGDQERQQTGGGATQTHKTQEPHQEGRGRAQQTRRRGAAGQERQPRRGTRMEGMGERAHGRQRQHRGWPGQSALPLPGARATPAQPASGGGCLPQPRWAVCATGARAHQGQTSCEGEKDIWWMVGTTRGGAGHLGLTHTETQRGRLWTACGQRGMNSKNSETAPQRPVQPQYANYWAPLKRKRHTLPHPAQPLHTNHWAPQTQKRHQQEHRPQPPTESSNPTQHAKGRTSDCLGPRKETITRRNVKQGGRGPSFGDRSSKAFGGPSHILGGCPLGRGAGGGR